MNCHLSLAAALTLCITTAPAIAQSGGAAGIEQIPVSKAPLAPVRVQPVGKDRSSATVQNPNGEKVPPLVSPETLAACQNARAADRPAPAGVDCVKALQIAAEREAPPAARPSAEGSLLTLFGQNGNVTTQASPDGNGSVSADQVSRQLSSGDFQGATGTTGSDAAASVARDRPPPQTTPPPR